MLKVKINTFTKISSETLCPSGKGISPCIITPCSPGEERQH